jgi:hypothetical protein
MRSSAKKSAKRSAKKMRSSAKKSAKKQSAKRSSIKEQKGSGIFKSKKSKKKGSVEDVFAAFSVSELNKDKLMQCQDDLQKVKSQLETCKEESSKREPSKPESAKLIAELIKHPKFSKKQQGSGLFKSKSKKLSQTKSGSLEDVFSALSVSELNTDKLMICEDKLQKTNVTLQEYKDQLERYEEEGVWMSKIIEDLRDENNKLREDMVRLEEAKSDLMYKSPIYGLDWDKIIELTDSYEMTIEKLKENENLYEMTIKKLKNENENLRSILD